MSDTLRYMNDSGKVVEGDAANAFLQNKLRSNISGKYTQQQIDRLNASGGPAVVNSNDGYIPTGAAYSQNNYLDEPKSSGDGGAAGSSAPSASSGSKLDKYRGFGSGSQSGRQYAAGNWAKGDLDAEALAEKYGLDRSNEARGDGHIWGKTETGEDIYIGKSNMGLASNKDLISAHGNQLDDDEIDHSASGEDLSSYGDIKGAILTYWDGSGGAKKAAPAKEQKPDPIRHSPELKQATERVRAYENDVMSGKTTDDIFNTSGGYNGDNNYTFDYNKGSDGIGTAAGAQSNVETKAASSFLDAQKTKIKKDYNFQPKESSSKYAYGAN